MSILPRILALLTCALAVAATCSEEDDFSQDYLWYDEVHKFNISVRVNDEGIFFPGGCGIPVLSNLTLTTNVSVLTHYGGRLEVSSPILAKDGRALWLVKADRSLSVDVMFTVPKIRARISLVPKSENVYVASAVVSHVFKRPAGVVLVRSVVPAADAVMTINKTLSANPAGPRLVATVDHSGAAKKVGLELPFSTVMVFGNPRVGSPLWRAQPEIGIELPLEMLVAMSPLGVTYICYNAPANYQERFMLPFDVSLTLAGIDSALAQLSAAAAGVDVSPAGLDFDAERFDLPLEGIASVPRPDGGKQGAIAAFNRLTAALEAAPPVNIAYSIPHDVSAANAGLETGGDANRVAVFGNPALGTPLMQTSFTAGLDLPLKMAAWSRLENGKNVTVGYTTPAYIAERHSIPEVDPRLENAAAMFAKTALGVAA